jgi:methyl-CpG-binding domain protein 4
MLPATEANDYASLRLAKIARNEARLTELGLTTFKLIPNGSPKKRKTAKAATAARSKNKKKPVDPPRRSSRATGPVDYKEEKLMRAVSSAPARSSTRGKGAAKYRDADESDDDEESDDDDAAPSPESKSQVILDEIKYAIERTNENLKALPLSSNEASEIKRLKNLGGDSVFHAKSIERWGSGVSSPAGCTWSAFYNSRLSVSPPMQSPLGLHQEIYAGDGWRLLVACALMTRCSSHATKDRCIRAFFDLVPSPTAFLSVDHNLLLPAINSLGFQLERVKACADITQCWLQRGEFKIDVIPVAKGGSKITGCGPFVVDSFELFAKSNQNHITSCGIYDVERYGAWLKKVLRAK